MATWGNQHRRTCTECKGEFLNYGSGARKTCGDDCARRRKSREQHFRRWYARKYGKLDLPQRPPELGEIANLA